MPDMHVRWLGPISCPTGYGQATHDYLMALHEAGVSLDIQPIHDANSEDLDPRYGSLLDLVSPKKPPTHIVVHTIPRYAHEFVTGNLEPSKGIKKICITTWETDKIAREDASRLAEAFDAVIVPATFCRDVFAAAGFPPSRIHVVPHTFDPRFWITPGAKKPRSGPYKFYSILSWNERKNPIGLLKAYLPGFTSKDDVLLRIATPTVNEEDLAALARCMGLPDLPPVEFLGCVTLGQKRLTETELRALHEDSDCYVSASRGEGWGLGAFEAAIVGNHVIVPQVSGWRDYLNLYGNKYYIGHSWTPAVTPEIKIGKGIEIGGMKISAVAAGAPTGIAGDQNWAEPDLSHLKLAMRKAYGRRLGKDFSDQGKFVELYGYRTVGPQLKAILEAV